MCRSPELGTVCKSVFRDSLLVLVQGLLFQSPGRVHPICPSFSWAGLFPVLSSPGAWPVPSSLSVLILPGCRSFSPGPQRHSCFSWGGGSSGCCYHYFASLTHMPPASGNRYDERALHPTCPLHILLSFLNRECFKKESQNGSFPRTEKEEVLL